MAYEQDLVILIVEEDTKSSISSSTRSTDRLSTYRLREVRDQLLFNVHKRSTKKNYHTVWENFNKFVIRLDYQPDTWEEKVSLYIAFLSENNIKSTTMRSYISAIKAKLSMDGYKWDKNLFQFSALTKACKLQNDRIKVRLPILEEFLRCILMEIYRKFRNMEMVNEVYNKAMYLSAVMVEYYGLFRIGEIARGDHSMKAKDVHIDEKLRRMLVVLHTSKTHDRSERPQKIAIDTIKNEQVFCPVIQTFKYSRMRKNYDSDSEQFYIFKDGSPLRA